MKLKKFAWLLVSVLAFTTPLAEAGKLQVLGGKTSLSIDIFIQDTTKGGDGLTGLVYNSTGLKAYYHRPGGSVTAITLATLSSVTASYSSGGLIELDATNMAGWYRFDPPDAAIAGGVQSVSLNFYGATNMVACPMEIELTATNNQDTVRMGLTALPNAAAEASGGLYTRGTGAGQINQPANGRVDTNVLAIGGTTQTARDIGASVLLSSGTGTGQLSLSSGSVSVSTLTANGKTDVGAAVVDMTISGHTTAGTVGALINSSGSVGDPLSLSVPGAYTAGSAGFALGQVNKMGRPSNKK